MPRVLMIIAPEGFRDEEYLVPKQAFEDEGWTVSTASTRAGPIKGSRGAIARADLTIRLVDARDYDAVVLVGGPGAHVFFDDRSVHALLRSFLEKGNATAAICVSPTTLANAGLLRGRKATVWRDEGLIATLRLKGAEYTNQAVTVDGQIITANGPGAAAEFAAAVVKAVRGG